jgi:hypothetical protein
MNSGRGKLFCKDHKTVALVQDLVAISKHPEILGFTVSYLMNPIQDQLSKSVMNLFIFALIYHNSGLTFCKYIRLSGFAKVIKPHFFGQSSLFSLTTSDFEGFQRDSFDIIHFAVCTG